MSGGTTRPNASGRRNRVAPDGSLAAVAERGLFWGNRGRLLDVRGELARHAQGRNWIICQLQFHGRHRVQWQPNRLTELYFLDEVTGLAAGHRPCGECRHADYQRFKLAWRQAHGSSATAGELDRRLHVDRWAAGRHRTHQALRDELPDGVIVRPDDGFWLVLGERVHRWSYGGYGEARPRARLPTTVDVQTPAATVAVLRAGYRAAVHPSAYR